MEPHPQLASYYGAREHKSGFVGQLFDAAAPHYDAANRIVALGSGAHYRKGALGRAGLLPGMRMLDVATGTGLVARSAAAILGGAGAVTGVDPSMGMLRERRELRSASFARAIAESLPFRDRSFDFVAMGFALRHVSDLETTFSEYLRVLRPGGKILLLEISRPRSWLGLRVAELYFGRWVPFVTRAATRSPDATRMMHYYWDTIRSCVEPQAITAALSRVGFDAVEHLVYLGIFSEYRARKQPLT